MTTGKTIALTLPTLVRKVMSLLSNTLSRFVMAFLPRSKSLLISWQHRLLKVQDIDLRGLVLEFRFLTIMLLCQS